MLTRYDRCDATISYGACRHHGPIRLARYPLSIDPEHPWLHDFCNSKKEEASRVRLSIDEHPNISRARELAGHRPLGGVTMTLACESHKENIQSTSTTEHGHPVFFF
jgi:hypothetical protein